MGYLLVFATVAPAVAAGINLVLQKAGGDALAGGAGWSLRWGLAPLCVALVTVAGLVLSGTSPGRPPSGIGTIMGVFPDVFLRYDSDWLYFFMYFLAGWGLYALRGHLDEVGRIWLPTLAVGFAAYAASVALAGNGPGGFMPGPQKLTGVALARHGLFALAVSCTTFGFLGFFHRFFNRPTRAGRYLADTAFWVYLVHQDLLNMVVLGWVRPWGLPQMAQAVVAVAITTGMALIAFELVIRRTPLTALFGPPRRKPLPGIMPSTPLPEPVQT